MIEDDYFVIPKINYSFLLGLMIGMHLLQCCVRLLYTVLKQKTNIYIAEN